MTDLNKRVLESSYFSVLTYEIFKSMFSLETDAKRIIQYLYYLEMKTLMMRE